MTCIVGLVEKDKVYLGGDAAGVGGYSLEIRKQPKVFSNSEVLFGYTTSFRMGQLLQYTLKVPEQSVRKDDFEYLCTDFVDALMSCFKNKKFSEEEKNVQYGGVFLVGYKGNLYKIEADFQVGQTVDNFNACGCGESFAMGALKSLEKSKLSAAEKVHKALQTAAYFSAGVSGPFTVICSDGKTVIYDK
jgi:ATP-dependent protease HslVU (ClpYQ) peptidase subunit